MSFLKSTKTVDGIMSAFSKTIAELDAVHDAQTEAAEQKREEAARLLAVASCDMSEAGRAASIANKLRGIVEA